MPRSRKPRGQTETATRIDRRTFLRSAGLVAISIPLAGGLLSACSSSGGGGASRAPFDPTPTSEAEPLAPTPTEEPSGEFAEAVYGGSLRVALIDEPPTFDIHQTTTSTTAFVSWHIFEALFTWDAEMNVMPELPDSYTVSSDGLIYRFTLRQDVHFHDGSPLTSRDVVASIERWGRLVGLGQSLMEAVDQIIIEDDLTFEIQLNEPFGTLPTALARQNQGCAIYPEWTINEVGDEPLVSLIGTGPYRFVEYQPDQHILLERFEVYTPAPGEVDGYGGDKHRFLDQLFFIAVSDEAARVAGLVAGDYHYLESVGPDQVETLEEYSDVEIDVSSAWSYPNLVINHRSELMRDQYIRRAVQIALDHEPILQAGYGEGFYRVDPSLLTPDTPWYTRAGEEYFNLHDLERAQFLLDEAEYDGTPVRFLVTQAYRDLFHSSIVIAQQLEDVGFTVDMQQFDWATFSGLRNEEDRWDLYLTLATYRPDPIMRNLTCEASGWWCDLEKEELLRLVQTESDPAVRFAIWEEVQQMFYEQVPRIKLGDTYPVLARSISLRGSPVMTQLQPAFWNSWLEDD